MSDWINWFRKASPYIHQHRNKTMVVALSGDVFQHPNFESLTHDIALLSSLGIRLVLVVGARPQIETALKRHGLVSEFQNGLRITTAETMPIVLEAYGRLSSELEAKLSMGVINSPMHGSSLRVLSGNFITAKPIGVRNGIDYHFTGKVRRVESSLINEHLLTGGVIIMSALGHSVTGDVFNLSYEALASEVAVQLKADKLILLGTEARLDDEVGNRIRQLTSEQVESLVAKGELGRPLAERLSAAAQSCQSGVARAHLLDFMRDGALLQELFTRDGIGIMVSLESYDSVRKARIEDVNGIQELIQPMEERGILVRRSRELLENELGSFTVNLRDNAIIACAALYSHSDEKCGELACFAVDKAYRREGRGDHLLERIENQAIEQGLEFIFVLTTQTEHWFLERGFVTSTLEALPAAKRYNSLRNAKVLRKQLV